MDKNIIEVLIEVSSVLNDLKNSIWELQRDAKEKREQDDYIGDLAGALATAQGEYKELYLNREGVGGPYADLEAIIKATREALSKNKLAFIQSIITDEQGSHLISRLIHESGQGVESKTRVIHAQTDKETGRNYEFLKRLHATSLLGIAPSRCDPELFDDNGVSQSEETAMNKILKPQMKPIEKLEPITEAQYKMLLVELDKYPELVQDILRKYNIGTLADLPASEYYTCIDNVRRVKMVQAEYLKKKGY